MNNLFLFDTSILFNLFANITSPKSQKKVEELISAKVYLSQVVMYELVTLIKVRLGTFYATEALSEILTNQQSFMVVSVEKEDEVLALQIMRKYDSNSPKTDYSMFDAIQLAQAQRLGFGIYTDDARMCHYNPKLVLVINPYEQE